MSDELLDMTAIARTISRARIPIVIGLIAGVILGTFAALYLAPYRSEGVYTIGSIENATPFEVVHGMSVPAFKIAYSKLDAMGFHRFLEFRSDAGSGTVAQLTRILASPAKRPLAMLPIYATTRTDLRELGESSTPQENSAVAVQVSLAARNPDEARREASIVGDFIGETIFSAQAEDLIVSRASQYEAARLTSENRVLEQNFLVNTTGQKIARLQALKNEFPNSRINDIRQIVSVGDGGANYLPLTTQLVGAKSHLTDLRETIVREERARNVAELLARYYGSAREAISEGGNSQKLLARLSALGETSFVQGATESELSEARNIASLDLYKLRMLRTRYLRFASGPTVGWRDPNRIWKYSAAGAVVGALLVALIAIGRRAVS